MARIPTHALAVLLAAAAAIIIISPSAAHTDDAERRIVSARAALLEGVSAIGAPGVPGPIAVYGPDVFAVVAASSGGRPAAVVAAAFAGEGRVVLFGHGGYLGGKDHDTPRLLANAAAWAAGGPAPDPGADPGADPARPRIGLRNPPGWLHEHLATVGEVVPLTDGWLDAPADPGEPGDPANPAGAPRTNPPYDVVFTGAHDLAGERLERLRRFVEDGGGLVTAELGWGWRQLNPGRDLVTEHGGNRLGHRWGYAWTGGHVDVPAGRKIVVDAPPPPEIHAGRALEILRGGARAEAKPDDDARRNAVATLTAALDVLPPDDPHLLPRLERLLKGGARARMPSAEKPITLADGLARVGLALEIRRARRLPPEEVDAHPAAARFPGAVPPKVSRARREVTIDASIPGWRSTGLYAPPGEPVVVRLPETAASAGLRIRVGAHEDTLWHKDAWRRAPEITREYPADGTETTVAGAFGGLLYVVVPGGSRLGALDLVVEGAVRAPHFVLGRTGAREWRERIRRYPAPWAELECPDLAITIPSEHVRDLDDPEALMQWWQATMDAYTDLAALDLTGGRRRPERFVADEQISAGYMHAGYPIMTHLDAAPRFVDLERLRTRGDWGMYHELGHNHQHPDWTFGGTGEVTCNIFSLYMMETRSGVVGGHEAMAPEKIARRKAEFVGGGRDFAAWKSDPFLALILYHEVKEAFGWDAYQRVFEEYRTLPDAERPGNDQQKRDQWMTRLSRTVGRNLGPFFESWGVPITAGARKSVEDLPAWMPEGE